MRRPRSGPAGARNEATVDFPEGITFTLDAEATDPIANLELPTEPPVRTPYPSSCRRSRRGRQSWRSSIQSTCARRVAAGIDVQYRWRITETDGDVVETPEQTLSWVDDRYDWTRSAARM